LKKYLVLGGSGFIGRELIKYLKGKGYFVVNIDLQIGADFDLKSITLANLDSYEGCFFLAWDVGGAKYINQKESWKSQFANNISILNTVVPQLGASKLPFLFVTSQLAGVDSSPYSLTKLIAEKYLRLFKNCVLARQWNAYGTIEAVSIKSHVISDIVSQAINTGSIKLITDGSEKRRFIHISDICSAYYSLINNNLGEIYDVRNEEYISIFDVAEIVSSKTGARLERGSKKGVTHNVTDVPLVPGWTPKISLTNGITSMIESF